MIPSRLIQTGKDARLSSLARASAANLRQFHQDWEYVFFDDDAIAAFMRNEPRDHQQAFSGFAKNIQRIDFFRYLAVYRLGGFYFDLDVLLWSDLRPLLRLGCVFPFEEITLNAFLREAHGMDWEIGNYGFGAEPGHPFLKAVIENCVRSQTDPAWVEPMLRGIPRFLRSDFLVLNSTGPGLVSRTLAENPLLASGLTVLFPENVCDQRSWHQFGDFGVHLMNGTWRDKGSLIRRRLANLWEAGASRRALAESVRQGPGRRVGAIAAPSIARALP